MYSVNLESGHKAPEVLSLPQRFRQASQVIAALVATLGLVVLCGWAFNLPTLTHVRPAFQSMKVNTALAFVCLGAALWLAHNDERQRARRILGLLVVIIAVATLAEYAFHVSLGIDELLFPDISPPLLSPYPGRMAVSTAISFLLFGLAVTFLGTKKAIALQRVPVHACFALSLMALCGYLYGVKSLYAMPSISIMAVHTAVGFAAACLAYFLARPDEGMVSLAASDTDSGFLLRTIIPVVIVVPVLIAWLRLEGQRANLYDTPFGAALQALAGIGSLSVLTMLIVRSMHRHELGRIQIGEALKKSEEKFSKAFRESPVAMTITGVKDHRYLDVSESFEQWTGWRRDEVIGRTPAEIGLWINPAERSEFVKRVLAEGAVRNQEIRYRRKDGGEMIGLGSGELIEIGNEQCVIAVAADITERKQAEVALLRYAAIVESSEDAIISKNLDGIIESWNAGAQRLFGFTEAEAVGQPVAIIIPSELRAEENEILEKLRAGLRIEHYETVRVTKEGKRVDVSLTVSPMKDSTGRVVGLSKIARDITQRKIAEERLRKSEAQFRTLGEAMPQLCWMANADGYTFWYNQRWYAYTGTTPEQMQGWGWQSVHDPRTLPSVLERWKGSISTGEPFDMVFPLRGADGVFRSFLTRVMPVKDAEGRVVRWFGTNTDITELRDAQEQLRTSEERLILAQQAAHIGTFEWNIRTDVNAWTPELEAIYGLPPGGFSRTNFAFESLVHSEDRARVRKVVESTLKTGKPTKGEWRVVWPDRSVHWVASHWQVHRDDSGEPLRMLGINMDITKRKQADEALSAMNRRLLEAHEEERSRIARELHDDIGQRLALLTWKLRVSEEALPAAQLKQKLDEAIKMVADLAVDIQALSHRLHAPKLEHLVLAEAAASLCDELSERQGVEIEFHSEDIPRDLPNEPALCLFRVLQEALQNAIKHSGSLHFQVSLSGEANQIHLSVQDSGSGFDVTGAMRARGLGLTSMGERLQLVHGELSIESQLGKGTTIHARVPVGLEQQQQAQPEM